MGSKQIESILNAQGYDRWFPTPLQRKISRCPPHALTRSQHNVASTSTPASIATSFICFCTTESFFSSLLFFWIDHYAIRKRVRFAGGDRRDVILVFIDDVHNFHGRLLQRRLHGTSHFDSIYPMDLSQPDPFLSHTVKHIPASVRGLATTTSMLHSSQHTSSSVLRLPPPNLPSHPPVIPVFLLLFRSKN